MTIVEQICAEAWAAFSAWTREHDPDGDMSQYEQVQAYGRWLDYQACLTQQLRKTDV